MKMKIKNAFVIASMCVGAYWIGKIAGATVGAKAVLNQYTDVIPDERFEVKLIDNAIASLTVNTKKGK